MTTICTSKTRISGSWIFPGNLVDSPKMPWNTRYQPGGWGEAVINGYFLGNLPRFLPIIAAGTCQSIRMDLPF